MARRFLIYVIGLTICCFLFYTLTHVATEKSVARLLNQYSQNPFDYVQNFQQLKNENQEQIANNFTQFYFLPWHKNITTQDLVNYKQLIEEDFNKFQKNPGIGANRHRYNSAWLDMMRLNADLNHFPDDNRNAITVHNTYVRRLPTLEPSYTKFQSPSEGYPFDNIQQSFIPAATPLRILHSTSDKAWYYVLAASYFGWIQNKDIAFAPLAFIQSWEIGKYAISLQDDISLFDGTKHQQNSRLGVLYPLQKELENGMTISIVTPTETGNASSKSVTVNSQYFRKFPLPLTNKNVATFANQLIGKPYGWGGIYGYRDCSAMTQDLMSLFGIWLPRNSSSQAEYGYSHIPLKGLSDSNKERLIIKQGIPWLTLIHLPGHIVLYIGEKNGHPMVFHAFWGLHIYKLFKQQDRIVIGKTIITPLKFGKQFINVSRNILSVADSMVILVPNSNLLKK